jgi:hypothetical protein
VHSPFGIQVSCSGAVQLFLQNVVAIASPFGGSMNVPQQTSSGPQPFVREHSNCVVVVQAAKSRHVPNAEPDRQQVCPAPQASVVYGLQDFPASVVEASGCSAAASAEPSPGTLACSLADEPHATESQPSAKTRGDIFRLRISLEPATEGTGSFSIGKAVRPGFCRGCGR